MDSYETIRQKYLPNPVKALVIAESPPPAATSGGSRHFYRTDRARTGDRLFINTIKALYPKTAEMSEPELEEQKEQWLRRFQEDGWYLIEALEKSLHHNVTKQTRQALIREQLPRLIERLGRLTDRNTKIILVKSNVFEAAAKPLRQAGFNILNTELVDYPGRFNQTDYRTKLEHLAKQINF